MDRDPDELLDGLDADQLAAVTSDAAPLAVIAGAGSGKTRVLTRRLAWRVATGRADASHVLVVTFTRKAAGELSYRLSGLGVRERIASGTFHSVAFAQLRRRWADRGEAAKAVVGHRGRLLAAAIETSGVAGSIRPADLAAEVDWAGARSLGDDAYEAEAVAAGRLRAPVAAAAARAMAAYRLEKRRRGVIDLDDLLAACATALEEDADFAAAQRWRFRHLFVDEFQDVNPLQFRLLRAWLGTGNDLFAVGDPAQAVYGWNGAEPGLLADFATRFPGSEVLRLPTNHRCSPQVVAVGAAALGAQTPPPASSAPGPAPTLDAYADEEAEAAAVAARARDANGRGLRWASMAVLARTNAQLPMLERALTEAGVPVKSPSNTPLTDHPAVRSALAATPDHRACATAVVDLRDAVEAALGSREAAVLGQLADLAAAYSALEPAGDVAGFRAWLAAGRDEVAVGVSADAVTVTTFHRAKGLEWQVVFVCGLEDGLVPSWSAKAPEALAEERRLLHVAVTRAERSLHLSWARHRTIGVGRNREPSPFLDDLATAMAEAGDDRPEAEVAARWLARLRAQRLALAGGNGAVTDPVER